MRFILLLMGMFIFLLILFLGGLAHAENWVRPIEIQAGMVRGFQLRQSCQSGGFFCLDIGSERPDEITVTPVGGGSYSFSVNASAKNARLNEEAARAVEADRIRTLAAKADLTTEEVEEAVIFLLGN